MFKSFIYSILLHLVLGLLLYILYTPNIPPNISAVNVVSVVIENNSVTQQIQEAGRNQDKTNEVLTEENNTNLSAEELYDNNDSNMASTELEEVDSEVTDLINSLDVAKEEDKLTDKDHNITSLLQENTITPQEEPTSQEYESIASLLDEQIIEQLPEQNETIKEKDNQEDQSNNDEKEQEEEPASQEYESIASLLDEQIIEQLPEQNETIKEKDNQEDQSNNDEKEQEEEPTSQEYEYIASSFDKSRPTSLPEEDINDSENKEIINNSGVVEYKENSEESQKNRRNIESFISNLKKEIDIKELEHSTVSSFEHVSEQDRNLIISQFMQCVSSLGFLNDNDLQITLLVKISDNGKIEKLEVMKNKKVVEEDLLSSTEKRVLYLLKHEQCSRLSLSKATLDNLSEFTVTLTFKGIFN